MIVDRLASASVPARVSGSRVLDSPLQPPASAFDQCLRQYRRRETETRGPSRDGGNERTTNRASRSGKPSGEMKNTDARRVIDDLPAMLAGPAAEVPRFIPVLTQEQMPASPQRKAASASRNLKRRDAEAGQRSECIEVVVERTGMRFLLSRDAGRWLVSIPSQALDEAQRNQLIELLREQFAARGLGDVDAVAA